MYSELANIAVNLANDLGATGFNIQLSHTVPTQCVCVAHGSQNRQ